MIGDAEDGFGAFAGQAHLHGGAYCDRKTAEGVVRRAEAAGCRAIVVTVDAPLLGRPAILEGDIGLGRALHVESSYETAQEATASRPRNRAGSAGKEPASGSRQGDLHGQPRA